jgi:hypothetical protein
VPGGSKDAPGFEMASAEDAYAEDGGTVPFVEAVTEETIPNEILNQRICDFDLRIEGRPLGRVIERFMAELESVGIRRLRPKFYLSEEWGVPEGTVAIGIPFYLADERLLKVQAIRGGGVEGTTEEEILRYLRHELGHVINYAYGLYAAEEWTLLFGPMARPYSDQYRAVPFSPDFVRHLPGNYAQKHPDEDWADTFAVWMTPGVDWRELYSDSPGALKKLEYCSEIVKQIGERDPSTTAAELDLEASQMVITLQDFYREPAETPLTVPRSLDGDLKGIFAPFAPPSVEGSMRLGSAALLLKRQADSLASTVYRWTGVDPFIVRQILGHMIRRAHDMKLTYPLNARDTVLVQLTGFLTTLAMNYVYKGAFITK